MVRQSSRKSPSSSSSSSPTDRRRRLPKSKSALASHASPPARKARPDPQAPKWMHTALCAASLRFTPAERAHALAILHIALDWTRASSARGWMRLGEAELPGYVVRRLYRALVRPQLGEEGSSEVEGDCGLCGDRETLDARTMRRELPTLIRWLPLPDLVDLVQLVEHLLPHLAAVREAAGEEYELDVDAWPEGVVRLVWGALEGEVRRRVRDEYAALLLAAEEQRGRYVLRSRR